MIVTINTKIVKRTTVLLLALCAVSCGAPEQKLRIRVTDESGTPLKDVACMGGWWKDVFVHGVTDQIGIVELTGKTGRHETLVKATIEGYYPFEVYRFMMTGMNGNHWQPWPVEVNLVMKKIRNPHPMYAVKFDGQKWLEFPDKKLGPLGVDLMEGGWMEPYGKGKVADFIIQGTKDNSNDESPCPKGKILLTFSNPCDGILSMDDNGGSVLVGPAIAPENGYQPQWHFSSWSPSTNESKTQELDSRSKVFIFRVRTKVDKTGKMASALYGKMDDGIVGKLSRHAPRVLMTYYINSTVNGRSLEWDLKNNLIPDACGMRIPDRP